MKSIIMALQRSKSAPQGVPALLPAPASSLVRAASFHTIGLAIKDAKTERLATVAELENDERDDAFNLSGFFPRNKKWVWSGEEEEEEKEGSVIEGGSLFGKSDRMTREAIKGEDKLGVLSLGTLLKKLTSREEEEEEETYVESRRVSQVLDEERGWQRCRVEGNSGVAATLDGDWKTPLESAIEEYFPIWDIDGGNSQRTKVPHDPFHLDHHLHMAQPEEGDQSQHTTPETLKPTVTNKQSESDAKQSPSSPSPTIVSADPNASLQSILAATKKDSPANGQPWTPLSEGDSLAVSQTAAGKRKLDEPSLEEDPHNKIRRIGRDHVIHDLNRVMPMTTVICLHAAVAQKSYGTEKRFLCPPPVVHIEGPVWHLRSQQLSMAVVSESGERSFEQKAPLDNNMTASFKFLHVTGTAKAKSFQLSLDIAEPPLPQIIPEGADAPAGRVWAAFDSAPVTIISKPSKKTAKTRNISSCILAGGPVSLFNRINSQTVRTKYMTIDHTQLCASNVAWSAFNVNVVSRPTEAPSGGPQPVTYGCEIVLSDTHSGISTSPLIIRKVDKGRVSAEDGGPVSQMQKIALQRVNPDGSRHYLSAAGPLPGTPGVVSPPAPGLSSQTGTHPLLFSSPRVRDEVKDNVRIISDEVDDYLCWTIVGISKFQYTFFDAFGQNNSIPSMPITPFPTLFTAPLYRVTNNSIELTVSNFFYEDPKTRMSTPLDIYLGNLGPLPHRIYQPTTAPGPLTAVSPFVQTLPGGPQDGGPSDPGGSASPTLGGPRFMPSPMHTIVIVEMPTIEAVIKALDQDALPPHREGSGSNHHSPTADGSAPETRNGPSQPSLSIAGRSLPLLFIRAFDGVGYHSGRTITCEPHYPSLDLGNIPSNIDPGSWMAAQFLTTMYPSDEGIRSQLEWNSTLNTAHAPVPTEQTKFMRKTSIIATIGPKVNTVEKLAELRLAGVNV
ncbi:hypothetical protein DXG01_011821, partial [Tephrocybe rancida]